eukprot:CAMPEP_0113937464 /NCGR_PEP_ID=MMETSP1339-20121228/4083_1 /TAXON_ID=94617 /ORGANISM="Fibrocapsa japonica" /LENGTH=285 /DNA_ID=CAMNT_0000940239 /DNA_START=128 /DNA_END=982 /DNA_ORIENTATION=- /assembly_acc=CAM_ASM_000762
MAEPLEDLEWEDWNPANGSFISHMLAGSVAGVVEHISLFPLDTVKTHIQCHRAKADCMECAHTSVWRLCQREGLLRLWRGVSTMLFGSIPAHASYFSVIEICKEKFGVNDTHSGQGEWVAAVGAGMAGGIATVFHDGIMTPMDVIKQRMQLGLGGKGGGILKCAAHIASHEGLGAFFRSLPTTLVMNVPYGCITLASNETIKRILRPDGDYDLRTHMVAGAGAGAIASAATTPLDVVKTRLQTQNFSHHPHHHRGAPSVSSTSTGAAPGRGSLAGGSSLSPGGAG